MRQRAPQLEWQFVENNSHLQQVPWPPLADTPPGTRATLVAVPRRYLWGGVISLCLLLVASVVWLWLRAEAGVAQIEGELRATVQVELAATPVLGQQAEIWATDPVWEAQLEREQKALHAILRPDVLATHFNTTLHVTNLHDDHAVTQFVATAKQGAQAYRQTRFYRQTAEGWQRSRPDDDLWGSPRTLESSHFIFHFRQNDAQVVAAVAAEMDALYIELLRNFGLTPDVKRLAVQVTTERVTGAIVTPLWTVQTLVVPSPATYLVPSELSDNTILAQSIALPLIHYMTERAIGDHAIPLRWRPMLNSVQLWQLWNTELPLATWQSEIAKWLFTATSMSNAGRTSVVPNAYTELCASHSLWMMTPVLVGIPLECLRADVGAWIAIRWLPHMPSMQLQQFRTPVTDYSDDYAEVHFLDRSMEVVAMTTLIEYAVAAYGYEQLPVLLASLAQHDSWDALLPAVYGVSTAEFEAGWQAYLAKEYGLQP